jgi:hypothetical protein
MQRDTEILQLALQQGGVVRRDQAIRAGFNDATIARRVTSGTWHRAGHGGYRLFESPGRLNLARAAVAVLPKAVVSHNSAAAIHRLPLVPYGLVTVSVHSRTTHRFPGVAVLRNHDLQSDHIDLVLGLPVTTPARTIIDLASSLSQRHLASVVDNSVAANVVSLDEMDSVLADIARRGKPGVQRMRAVLNDRLGDPYDGTILERRGIMLLAKAGIDGFVQEYPFPWAPTKRFDVAFPAERLAIEWDSRRWHLQMDAMRHDRSRDREAIQRGWRILRFTWADVHHAPEIVVDSVRSVLAA